VLIIWDRLFGTFAEEEEAPVYGLIHPLNNRSFLWQHLHFPLEIAVTVLNTKGLIHKFKVIFGSPDLVDPRARGYLERKFLEQDQRPKPSKVLLQYIKLQCITTLLLLFLVLLFEWHLSGVQLLLISTFILISVICSGAMLELRKWIFNLEIIRFWLVSLFVYSYWPNPVILLSGATILLLVCVYYKTISHQYFSLLFRYR
jgi:alkylglycerol monooxygenase